MTASASRTGRFRFAQDCRRHDDSPAAADVGDRELTNAVAAIVERSPSPGWVAAFSISALLTVVLVGSLVHLLGTGIGVWGNSQAVGWAWDITGFVFWIGIGHAGTLISAALYLLRQRWRVSMSRAAEAMTLIAVATATIYPLFHLGRVWLSYWVFPVPNQMGLWPNFRSPLVWDAFAVSSYFLVSAMFWYLGLVPDLATMRDRATDPRRRLLWSWFALGWRGSQRHWHHYDAAYLVLAGLCTPLVVSVHSIVSLDFAVTVLPGWHSTLFPAYFVAGAVLSGSAMVVLLMAIVRRACRLEHIIVIRHLENMNKLVLATATMVAYAYGVEWLLAFIGEDSHERELLLHRALGHDAWAFWLLIVGNVVLPQLYWSRRLRGNVAVMIVISIGVTVAMWLERYVIIVSGLDRRFLPATWERFAPTVVDVATFVGSVGVFFMSFLLFIRFVPAVAMSEFKALNHEALVANRRLADVNDLEPKRRAEPARERMLRLEGGANEVLLVGRYRTEHELIRGCRRLREAGAITVDGHAPYAIRGLRRALGLGPSPIPAIALVAGLVGLGAASCFQVWTHGSAEAQPFGDEAALAWQAFVPVAFEVGILFAAFAAFAAVWLVNRLPEVSHPLLNVEELRAASTDGLFASMRAELFDSARFAALLESTGAYDVVEVVP